MAGLNSAIATCSEPCSSMMLLHLQGQCQQHRCHGPASRCAVAKFTYHIAIMSNVANKRGMHAPAAGSVVISTAPTLTIPFKIDAACSNSGAAILQCPHQGATIMIYITIKFDKPILIRFQNTTLEILLS